MIKVREKIWERSKESGRGLLILGWSDVKEKRKRWMLVCGGRVMGCVGKEGRSIGVMGVKGE